MATPTYTQVATRWYAMCVTGRGVALKHPFLITDGDVLISSEGDEMARCVREKNGTIRMFLLNGDGNAGRVRFLNQQWEIRAVVQAQMFPSMILPYAALDAAGIDPSTIVPIEVRPDEWITTRTWYESFKPEDIVWERPPESSWNYQQTGRISDRPDLVFFRLCKRSRPGSGYHHSRRETELIPEELRDPVGVVHGVPGMAALSRSGKRYYSDRQEHRLGDSVFRARAHGATRTFVSSFDYQETRPLYFLAELPWKARVESVDQAIEALAPPLVRQARKQKRLVLRQGDIFSVPTDLTTEQIKERTGDKIRRMQGVLGTDHVVTESLVGRRGVTYARGWMHHRPEGRRPDHRRVFLGKKWHLIVPNAVPRRRAGAMVRG